MTGEIPHMGAEVLAIAIAETPYESSQEPSPIMHGRLENLLGVNRMGRTGLDRYQVEAFVSDVVFPALDHVHTIRNSKLSRPLAPTEAQKVLAARKEEISLMTQGLNYKEIGEKVGLEESTVKTNIRRTFGMLREEYSPYDSAYFLGELKKRHPEVVVAERPLRVATPRSRAKLQPVATIEAPSDVSAVPAAPSARAQSAKPKASQRPESKPAVTKDEKDEEGPTEDTIRTYLKGIGKTALLTAEEEVDLAKRIEAGLFAGEALKNSPVLSLERRRDLSAVARDGERAKDHFIRANLGLVVSIAKRYTGRGLAFDDLIQEGNLGMMHALKKFDYTEGNKFSTYATWWIRRAVTRGLMEQGRTIHLPVHTVEQINKLERLRRELYQQEGRAATLTELSDESGIPEEEIADLFDLPGNPASLDEPVGAHDETPLGEFIEDGDSMDPGDVAVVGLIRSDIHRLVGTLTTEEQAFVRLRFGFDDDRSRNLKEICNYFGCSADKVHRIERDAFRKLRSAEYQQALLDYAS